MTLFILLQQVHDVQLRRGGQIVCTYENPPLPWETWQFTFKKIGKLEGKKTPSSFHRFFFLY